MESKRLLILSVSVGHGHARAAEALAAGVEQWFPEHEARHIDLLTLTPALFRKAYKDMYLKLVQNHPEVWAYIYNHFDNSKAGGFFEKMRRKLESACNHQLRRVLGNYAPDYIICTHFMPQQVLARWKRKKRISLPLWSCITDFVAHRFWLEEGMDGYFTATVENEWRMRQRGLADANIYCSGIPVLPSFSPPAEPAAARRQAAGKFSLDPDKLCFLLMGGGAGIGDMQNLAGQIMGLPKGPQLVVLCGNNNKLLGQMRAMDYGTNLLPLGFTNEVAELLSLCDLVITKPGGLTTVECLAMGKPMLIYSPIPGQEEYNADYLLENRAALKAPDASGLMWRIERLLREKGLLSELAANAAALGKPDAARQILATVLGASQ
ncbi:MAG: glycosyltransferase [Desulfarculales bacterium]|jgi:processive 1,2-diacylglycerol beta-glucosyltransferase|nr:glycosyltransferase [Desulfarculales bacterium]